MSAEKNVNQIPTVGDVVKEATGMSIGWAIVLIVLGVAAILMPRITGVAISVFVGAIMALAGLALVAYAFGARGAGAFIERLILGLLYVFVGGYLMFHPTIALETMTIVLAVLFIIGGIVEIVLFFRFRTLPNAAWMIVDGLLSFVLAYLILRPYPTSSSWAIGIILGVYLIMSGISLLVYTINARKMLKGIV